MKILHFADLHVKLKSDIRFKYDLLEQLRFILNIVSSQKPDYLFFAGDLFDKKEPIPAEYSLAHIFLKQILDLGCKIIMIPGNHDLPDNEESHHTLKPLKNLNLNGLFILDEEGLYRIENIDVLAIPYKYHNKVECLNTIKQLHDNYNGNDLYLIGHFWVNEYSSIVPASHEFVLSSAWLKSLTKVKYGAIGHIHTGGQIIGNFYYSGSPYRVDWGEEEPAKFLSIYDSTSKVEFINTNSRPIQVFDFDKFDKNKLMPAGAMIKILAKDIDTSEIITLDNLKKELESSGYIVHIVKKLKPITYGLIQEPTKTQKVTLSGYINDYVKRNDIVAEQNILVSICEDIISGKIKMETSPFDIPILGLKK